MGSGWDLLACTHITPRTDLSGRWLESCHSAVWVWLSVTAILHFNTASISKQMQLFESTEIRVLTAHSSVYYILTLAAGLP